MRTSTGRREFLRLAAMTAAAGSMLSARGASALEAEIDGPALLSTTGCGRATGYAESNKIVTVGKRTHVTWLDSHGGKFLVRARTYRKSTGWSPTYPVGEAVDNHGGPALAIDGDGHLHVVYGPHHHPLRYRRSRRPNDVSEWGEELRFGKRCTYPTLVCDLDGSLHVTCRESDQNPWVVNLYTRPPGKAWQGPRTILRAKKKGYSHFQEALVLDPSRRTLHLSCRFYDGKRGHTVSYLRSRDGGQTWSRSDGKRVALPATADTAETIARAPEKVGYGLRCGAIALGPRGRVFVLYSYYDDLPVKTWLAELEAPGRWKRRNLLEVLPAEHAGHGLVLPGGVSFDTRDGAMSIVLTRVRPESGEDGSVWGHPSSEVLLLVSRDGGETFETRLLTKPDAARPRWLPNIERPVGHNRVERPGILFTDGFRGENNRQIVSNRVLFYRPRL